MTVTKTTKEENPVFVKDFISSHLQVRCYVEFVFERVLEEDVHKNTCTKGMK
jgi:hypothetical protein